MIDINKDILVVARNRAFWSTDVAQNDFKNQILLTAYPTPSEELKIFPKLCVKAFSQKPKVIVFGTTTRMLKWFLPFRKIFLPNTKIITDNQQINDDHVKQIEKVIVYSHEEVDRFLPELRNRFVFLHYPSKKQLVELEERKSGDFIFCGGNHKRDHQSFFDAIRNTDIPAKVVTDQELPKDIPGNVQTFGHLPLDEYIQMMKDSRFVVVPLLLSKVPHGHCDISNALSVGKAIITTKSATAGDYITHNVHGILVEAGNVEEYKNAILKLWNDSDFRNELEKNVQVASSLITYEKFSDSLKKEIEKLLV